MPRRGRRLPRESTARCRGCRNRGRRSLLWAGAACDALRSDVSAGRVSELVGGAIELNDIAERVLAVDHAVRFLAGEVVAHLLHPLAAAKRLDELHAFLELLVLQAKVEEPRPPIFEGLLLGPGLGKLEQLDADTVAGSEMRNAKAAPAGPKHVIAHLSDGAVVLADSPGGHDNEKTKRIGI